ncbi:MAG: RNase adapter RapZ [Paludibacterium sp.]|uniref:RNase adapter RapZ n=1 Tax=Paludibacterium sp. TaxID=1917523 RepID=UPI0025F1FBF3|nr:RNase adapter RapZ [Paludibacterium sp.]MBV8048660.1 RNase adapter RapZ [Paludibacterium sp.]MBV8645940.1 RNase adapter RapZ [Paludibacterium sp.]
MQLILISGQSGSGKSIALRALEDSGFYCVDNLPATMLSEAVALYQDYGFDRIGISVDVRSSPSLGALPHEMSKLREQGVDVRLLYLEAQDDILVKRFSETRRRHPLAGNGLLTINECILAEKEMLAGIQELGARFDTTDLLPNTLRSWVKDLVSADSSRLTLVLQSFGFKHGVPLDLDFAFDVRCLPNPYYVPELRPLTGLDQPIIDYFLREPAVAEMTEDIRRIIARWLPAFSQESRSYLTVAIGCTGGQHRSVYIAEQLAASFPDQQIVIRHRQLQQPE